MKNPEVFKWYEGRKRVKDLIVVIRDGKIERVKKINTIDQEPVSGYILHRKIESLEDEGIEQCSSCSHYFPDGLNPCEHCDELFCCDCADEHRWEISDEISTGGCNF